MAAKFEVYIVSKKYPSIKMCETIFPIVGKIQFSEKCVVWNGWLPTKEDVLYTQDDEQIERCVLNGKIVSFDGKAGSYIIGARQYFSVGAVPGGGCVLSVHLPLPGLPGPVPWITWIWCCVLVSGSGG